jgi:hypothetical protein
LDRELSVNEPDYDGFWRALPDAALCRDEWDINEEFRRQYREEIIGVLNMLRRLGLVWGATALHPQPPEQCDFCHAALADHQMFVDGVTADSGWAIMCAKCFFRDGLAIGPLTGQLYVQIESGKWRMVVGSESNGEDETTLSLPRPLKRSLSARIFDWLRTKRPADSKKAEREPSRPMYCGTPAIWRGTPPASDDPEMVFAPPRGNPSARPTYHRRNH